MSNDSSLRGSEAHDRNMSHAIACRTFFALTIMSLMIGCGSPQKSISASTSTPTATHAFLPHFHASTPSMKKELLGSLPTNNQKDNK